MMQRFYQTCLTWVQGLSPGHCAAPSWVTWWVSLEM
jgi:hypothetical protein